MKWKRFHPAVCFAVPLSAPAEEKGGREEKRGKPQNAFPPQDADGKVHLSEH